MSLRRVRLAKASFDVYRSLIDKTLYSEVKKLASELKGIRILHINSTDRGGGVAQLLQSLIPLYNDLEIYSKWKVVEAPAEFYTITKKLHNGLQGDPTPINKTEWDYYKKQNQAIAKKLKTKKWDVIFIHDPQPAAIPTFAKVAPIKWIWRCHIDLSKPNKSIINSLTPYLKPFNAAIYTLKSYKPTEPKKLPAAFIAPAIDPFSETNRKLTSRECTEIVAGYGVDIKKPFICQISRFDPWKDPIGVIKVYRLAKKYVPKLQLVLMGDAAADDPEGKSVLGNVIKFAGGDEDIHIITDSNSLAVNAFQTLANVVLQKSIREGFALTVSEALWAATPVIGGNVGGIPTQIKNGKNGFLVSSISEAAERVVQLLENPRTARKMGEWGHNFVAQNFLMARLLHDELKLIKKLTQS